MGHQTLNQWFSNWGRGPFGLSKTIFWDRKAHSKKNQNDAPEERKILYKKDFQATYLSKPKLANIICYENLQATYLR